MLCSEQVSEVFKISPVFPEIQSFHAELIELRSMQMIKHKKQFGTSRRLKDDLNVQPSIHSQRPLKKTISIPKLSKKILKEIMVIDMASNLSLPATKS